MRLPARARASSGSHAALQTEGHLLAAWHRHLRLLGRLTELISRLRDGRLDTTPTPLSGWYDHHVHALVPFLMPERMPEAERMLLGPRYRSELEKQFRALFALTRETHLKQLEQLAAGGAAPSLIIQPELSLELLAEFYLRRAEGRVPSAGPHRVPVPL